MKPCRCIGLRRLITDYPQIIYNWFNQWPKEHGESLNPFAKGENNILQEVALSSKPLLALEECASGSSLLVHSELRNPH